ncbi:OmpA family protein [Thiomicrorhabdus xiamenensis]|uniref:OmpA family protein n=1 Tax=Thiomicrorhabdus xiamenensis TaxID=2739063 RepID=A0A7D4P3S7_9GAMM|nr:OmpA family protein [Thiomicrorhabdus xiamenensis]QKI88395.1 OmpA family protein [Thiomicrorhabdus xiamenensis]
MKTKLLPLIAFVSAAAMMPAANAAEDTSGYVTDANGAIVKDSSGQCVRSSAWTPEKAIASCEAKTAAPAAAATTEAPAMTAAAPAAAAAAASKYTSETIMDNGMGAYVVDSQGRIVRDSMNRCVRSTKWSKDSAIAKCEGWEEEKPAAPTPAPVAAPKPEIKPFPAPAPEVKPMPVNEPIHFQGFFDFDSNNLNAKAKTQLNDYADYMKAVDDVTLKITGHTDSVGAKAYNQALSERRASAVKTYLEEQGIAGDRMTAIGMGESSPIASNKTKDGRAQNRRVEIEIVK